MISERMEKMLVEDMEDLVKPASEVAVVGEDNTLDHALLLMTTNKYSVVPVIDRKSRLKGLISMPLIMESIIDIQDVQFDQLAEFKVKDVMSTEFPVETMDFELEDVLRTLIHNAFISIVDERGVLVGIITRHELLTGLNRIVHNFEREYDVREKEIEHV